MDNELLVCLDRLATALEGLQKQLQDMKRLSDAIEEIQKAIEIVSSEGITIYTGKEFEEN